MSHDWNFNKSFINLQKFPHVNLQFWEICASLTLQQFFHLYSPFDVSLR
jgi:hypothetical protein